MIYAHVYKIVVTNVNCMCARLKDFMIRSIEKCVRAREPNMMGIHHSLTIVHRFKRF